MRMASAVARPRRMGGVTFERHTTRSTVRTATTIATHPTIESPSADVPPLSDVPLPPSTTRIGPTYGMMPSRHHQIGHDGVLTAAPSRYQAVKLIAAPTTTFG